MVELAPFQTPRPAEYAPIPKPLKKRDLKGLKIPDGPRSAFLTLRFQRDTPAFLLDARDRYGDCSSFLLGGQLFITAFSPEMVHEVTVSKQSSFIKGVGFDRMRKVLGSGLLTNEEPIHLRHRRLMQSPFHISKISSYAQTMLSLTRKHISNWKDGQVVALGPEMMSLTFDIVADILFGTDISADTKRVQDSMHIAIDRIERTMLPGLDRLDNLPIAYFRKFEKAANELHEVATRIVNERIASGIMRDDLMGVLLEAQTVEGERLTPREISDETLTLILSGHETTANVLTWTFAYLSQNPRYWDGLAEEAEAVFAKENDEDFAKALLSAPLSGAIFSEVLRLAPPVWVSPRRALEDITLGGKDIPKGAHVLLSQYVTQRDEKYFSSANEFIPERWSGEFEKSLPRGAYFPFLAGSRKCLGDQFALLEGRIIILEMARGARLSLTGEFPKAQPRATYRPKGAVAMKVELI
ncbi:MAG: cytochrome P450 [Actinobacteria bacterium]|nr:cytochrome P450 [Actinomycetota bacterium]